MTGQYLRIDPSDIDRYRRMYRDVGGAWSWVDRLKWPDDRIRLHLSAPKVAVWELSVQGAFAGYFELEHLEDGSVEIAYFGLVPAFFGKRLGAAMLARAVDEAWAMGATRVWLHTCTLDSPHALPNYKARGFDEFKVERYETPGAPDSRGGPRAES